MFDTNVDLMPLVLTTVNALLIPLLLFGGHLLISVAEKKLAPYLGEQRALAVQQRANEVFDKGIGDAALHYLPQLQAHGLTIDVGNALAAHVADYFMAHAPDLGRQIGSFERSLEDKARARLITHPAIATAVASGQPALAHAA